MKKLNYDWLKSRDYPQTNGLKVFGTFVCGGGSTMGYKLAGFEHLGGVEIDKRMGTIYELNHKPKYFYLEDIRDFNNRTDLPSVLFDLEVLDGSPPCSTFSMSGKREKGWGVEKVFKEGQKKQTLDDLVFVYCDTIEKLKPKVAILENVPGIVAGNAKGYTIEIVQRLNKSGYNVQIFQLNSATMGVPQARERIFFIARRKDLGFSPLVLDFQEPPIFFRDVVDCPKDKRIVEPQRSLIIERVLQEEQTTGYVDYITLSSNIMFSMKYVLSYEQLAKETLYNCVRMSNYNADNYLDGVIVESLDYKELFMKYQDNKKVVFLVDPPYLSTEVGTYKNYWKLKDYLDVLDVLNGTNYIYFTSNKSNIIELCEWMANKPALYNPFAGSTTSTVNNQMNYNSSYTDIMLHKVNYEFK